MKEKKEIAKKEIKAAAPQARGPDEICNKNDLRQFLTTLRTRMDSREVAPVYAFNAMQHVFNLPDVDAMLDAENQDLARVIWLKLKQAGVQISNPPMLFPEKTDGPGPEAA